MILQFFINGLITGVLYSLSAIGFALVYNTTKIFHIAAAALYVVAAYLFYFTYHTLGFILWLSIGVSLVLTAVLSMISEWIVYRPLYNKKSSLNVTMISSIGLMTVLVNVIAILFGNEAKVIDNTIRSGFIIGELIITYPQVLQLVFGVFVIMLFMLFLRFTRFGLTIKALSNNNTLFETMGFSIAKTRMFAFAFSGIFFAIGSCLTVYDVGMNPQMGMALLINAMVSMIIGGVGRFDACVIGGISLGIIQSLVDYQFSASWQNAITFIVLLFFLLLRPQGIVGYKKRMI